VALLGVSDSASSARINGAACGLNLWEVSRPWSQVSGVTANRAVST